MVNEKVILHLSGYDNKKTVKVRLWTKNNYEEFNILDITKNSKTIMINVREGPDDETFNKE
jgi:hypothetical protein